MTQPFIRVDVWDLPSGDQTLAEYAGAVESMRAKPASDPTSWAYQAAIHGTYAASPLALWNQCRHGSWYFVPWHRMYLYYFERIVRAQVVANGGSECWALPYWNYDGGGNHNTLPMAFRDPTLAGGAPNPLYEAQRNPGINSGAGLPHSITSPAIALACPIFTGTAEFGGGITSAMGQFWQQTGRLEQTPHNDIHNAIGGLMSDPDTAAEDPIFWLHHANIDRIWWLWEQNHSNPTDSAWTGQSFDFMDVGGAPASLTDAGVENTVAQLDYTYDHSMIRFPWPWPRPIRPWPWKLKVVEPIRWPLPWPPGPINPPDPGPEGETVRQLIGASEEPVTLVGDQSRVRLAIDERTANTLRAEAPEAGHQHRAFVDIEDIEAEKNPGTIYGVYVNLPQEPTPADLATHHVGNVSLFGVERARNPRGDEHAHGMHLSMEITSVLDDLAQKGEWSDGQQLEVTLQPITLIAPPEQEKLAAEIASSVAHPDVPITIGRISVHYA